MKNIFTILGILSLGWLQAQTLSIGAFTIVPANPTTTDNVMVLTNVTTPNLGTKVGMSQSTSGTFTHNLSGCYWPGMLTALKTFVDTFYLGQLPAGIHSVYFEAKTSSSYTSCVVTHTSSSTTSFVVTGLTTGLKENSIPAIEIWPNPARDKIYLSTGVNITKALIFDANGKIIREVLPEQFYIDIRDLTNGLYFLRLENETGRYYYSRVVKISE